MRLLILAITLTLTPNQSPPSPPPLPHQMTLTGCTAQPKYMGVYERSEKTAHGAPVFVKKAGNTNHYLCRYTEGKWFAVDDEKLITSTYFSSSALVFNKVMLAKGGIRAFESSKAADLPSEAGLTWTSWNGKAHVDDPAMACTAVRETWHEPSYRFLLTPVPTVYHPPRFPLPLDLLTLPCPPTHPLTHPTSRRVRRRPQRGSQSRRQRRRG